MLFNDFDASFSENYTLYIYGVKNLKETTLTTYLSIIKAVLKIAAIQGYHSNMAYMAYKVVPSIVDKWCPDKLEMDRFFNEPTLEEKEKYIRDIAYVAHKTAFRVFSDLMRFNYAEHIVFDNGFPHIKMIAEKTKNTNKSVKYTFVPISETTHQILKDYQHFSPVNVTTFNLKLRKIARRVFGNETIILIDTRGGA